MTTNEKIQAVLATGKLGMPEGLTWNRHGFWTTYGVDSRDVELPDQQAYDLIAMHLAREADYDVVFEYSTYRKQCFLEAMQEGDSEAAIGSIHAALCGEATRDA